MNGESAGELNAEALATVGSDHSVRSRPKPGLLALGRASEPASCQAPRASDLELLPLLT
jgi:hypothetical protein